MIDDKQIIRYLDGEMTQPEKLEFEKAVSADPDLAEKVETFRELQELAGKVIGRAEDPEESLDSRTLDEIHKAVLEFKQGAGHGLPPEVDKTIQDARQAFEQKRDAVRRDKNGSARGQPLKDLPQTKRIWFRAAAVAVLVLIVAYLVFRPFRSVPEEDLFAKYYQEYALSEDMLELSRSHDDLLFALKVYEAGDYERALVLFDMLADSSEFRQYSRFFTGHAYLHLNHIDQAIESFEGLLEEGAGDLETATSWYLALCYLKTGDATLSREQLEQVSGTDTPYGIDAGKLLRELP
jgi:tetratricopeptide (TPR) repeat protein